MAVFQVIKIAGAATDLADLKYRERAAVLQLTLYFVERSEKQVVAALLDELVRRGLHAAPAAVKA